MLTEDQKRLRLTGVGGSEIGAILGLNKYQKPIDVYRAKTEPGYSPEVGHHAERGTFLEDGVARWFAHRTGSELREVGTIVHPGKPIVLSTPDRLARMPGRDEIDLSIKFPGPRAAFTTDPEEAWGEQGTDSVPSRALVQVQWELIPLGILYGIREAAVAAPLDGDLRIYRIAADPELQAMMMDEAERFWRNHVEKRTPPPVDGSSSYGEWLAHRPRDEKESAAPPEAKGWANILETARIARETVDEKEAEARNHLIALMGDASVMVGDGFRISYKQTKGRTQIDWKAIAEEARVPLDVISKHTKRGAAYRQFRPTFGGKDE